MWKSIKAFLNQALIEFLLKAFSKSINATVLCLLTALIVVSEVMFVKQIYFIYILQPKKQMQLSKYDNNICSTEYL